MNKKMTLLSCIGLLILGTAAYAEGERPCMGVQLDPAPLPELLAKHLALEAGQGIRISNIRVGSPADKIGLERDDLIIAFQGQKVSDSKQIIEAVVKAGVGAKVSLEVIHTGQRKSLELELAVLQGEGEMKYPPEPEAVTSWRPGKVFRVGPNGREWMEIPLDRLPDFNFDVKKLFKETYTYHRSTDGEDYTISIEGNPEDPESQVTVRAGAQEYTTTRGNLEALPEKYRGPAKEALDNAGKSVKKDIRIERRFRWPEPPSPEVYRKYLEALPRPDMERWSEQKDRILEKMQEQMDRLQQRMQELEQRNREMLDKLLEKKEMKKGPPEKPAAPEPEQNQAI
jgi:hypothetical protein